VARPLARNSLLKRRWPIIFPASFCEFPVPVSWENPQQLYVLQAFYSARSPLKAQKFQVFPVFSQLAGKIRDVLADALGNGLGWNPRPLLASML
jgi:hypothetical protein